MTRNELIEALTPYFDIDELVCPHTYQAWGVRAWQFLDTALLECILVIRRDILKRPMVVNNKFYTQRGLRCNRCQTVRDKAKVYLSSHILGKAIDFTVQGLSAESARVMIKANAHLLPCNIRLEKDVNWVHIDVLPQYGITQKVYEFKG